MFFSFKRLAFRKFRRAETHLHKLNYLFWECTTRCNLNCLHCGSDCHVDSTHPDMPLEDFLRALDTIENPAKNFIVALTSGEPLLRNKPGNQLFKTEFRHCHLRKPQKSERATVHL